MNIGFLGLMQSGKSTCAEYIKNNYNYEEKFFAEGLKYIIQYLFEFSEEQLYGSEKQKIDKYWGISARQAMQFIGTDLFRDQMDKLIPGIGQDFWVRFLGRNLDSKKNHVFSDCRMQNELDFIKKFGNGNGVIVKIIRPIKQDNNREEYSKGSREEDPTKVHKTESGIDQVTGYDYVIINDGSKEDLYKKLDELMLTITNSIV